MVVARPLRLAPLLVAVVVALVACGSAAPPAATVGSVTITDEQLAHDVKVFGFLSTLGRQPCGSQEVGESAASACARYTLSNVIEEQITSAYATDHHITVSDADVSKTLNSLDGQVGAKQIDAELKANGLTRDDLDALVRRFLLFGAVRRAVTRAGISDTELQQLYDQQILQYTTVEVAHILVKTKAEAEQVYQQVTAPGATEQDFLDLAKQVSIDPSAKQNSGLLGSAVASTYVPAFGEAAAALEPGQISRPVHTRFGWHVIRMVKKDVQSFDQVKPQLLDSRSIIVFNGWMRDQLTKQGVVVNPRYGRYDLAGLQVARISSTVGGAATAVPSTPSATATP